MPNALPQMPSTEMTQAAPANAANRATGALSSAADPQDVARHPLGVAKGGGTNRGMADPHPDSLAATTMAIGRRKAPRLRISLPGHLTAIDRVHSCILLNLSRTGAQVAILDSMREGEGAILRCGVINQFVIVARSEFGLNGLTFDEPLSDQVVLEIRRYHENFEERERRALIETARKWVNGDTEDERPI